MGQFIICMIVVITYKVRPSQIMSYKGGLNMWPPSCKPDDPIQFHGPPEIGSDFEMIMSDIPDKKSKITH